MLTMETMLLVGTAVAIALIPSVRADCIGCSVDYKCGASISKICFKTDKASEDYCCAPKEDCDADCENPDGCSQTSSQHPYECHEPTTTVTTATATSTTTTCGNRNQYYPYECLDTTTTIAPVTNRHCGHSFGCGPESDDDADNDIYDQSKQFGNWARVAGAVVGGLFCLGIFGFVCCAAATGKLGNNANQRQAPTFGADNTAAGSPYGI